MLLGLLFLARLRLRLRLLCLFLLSWRNLNARASLLRFTIQIRQFDLVALAADAFRHLDLISNIDKCAELHPALSAVESFGHHPVFSVVANFVANLRMRMTTLRAVGLLWFFAFFHLDHGAVAR